MFFNIVECYQCKCLLRKSGAKKADFNGHILYFCEPHKPNFDRATIDNSGRTKFYKEFEAAGGTVEE